MALAIFEATAQRVTVGELFDTNKRYVYRDTSGALSSSFVKLALEPTIVGFQDKLTYSFDGGLYYINQNLGINPAVVVIGTI